MGTEWEDETGKDKSGKTYAIGTRSSARYCRVYNKAAEQGVHYPPGDRRGHVEASGCLPTPHGLVAPSSRRRPAAQQHARVRNDAGQGCVLDLAGCHSVWT